MVTACASGTVAFHDAAIFVGDPVTNDTTFDVATGVTKFTSKKLFVIFAKRNNI